MNRIAQWGPWAAFLAVVLPCLLGLRMLTADDADGSADADAMPAPVQTTLAPPALDSLGRLTQRISPFRVGGQPSPVAYDPARTEVQAGEYVPPKPSLRLVGWVGGAAPIAMIQGVPGHDGPVVFGVGDTLRGLKVQRIKEGAVTVIGMDTTWVLALRGTP